MKHKEALEILALLQANWSHRDLEDLTIEVWWQELRLVPHEEGLTVAREIIDECQHFPVVAEFRNRRTALRRRRRNFTAALPEPDEVCRPEVRSYYTGRIREQLARMRARERGLALPPDRLGGHVKAKVLDEGLPTERLDLTTCPCCVAERAEARVRLVPDPDEEF